MTPRVSVYHGDAVTHDSRIDAYLATLPADQREALQHLRAQVARLVPEAEETISYGMPASGTASPTSRRVDARSDQLWCAWPASR